MNENRQSIERKENWWLADHSKKEKNIEQRNVGTLHQAVRRLSLFFQTNYIKSSRITVEQHRTQQMQKVYMFISIVSIDVPVTMTLSAGNLFATRHAATTFIAEEDPTNKP